MNAPANPLHSMATPEWYTPAPYVEAGRMAMGGIDLDPQSCAAANDTVRATRYLTIDDDCFRYEWVGRIWLNPAGGIVAESWQKLLRELAIGNVTAAIWVGYSLEQLQTLQRVSAGPVQAAKAICYCNHRVKWECSEADRARMQAALDAKRLAQGKPRITWRNSPTHGNFFAYFGPNPVRFRRAFRVFGEVRL